MMPGAGAGTSMTPGWCLGVPAMDNWIMPGDGVDVGWDFKDARVVRRSLCYE